MTEHQPSPVVRPFVPHSAEFLSAKAKLLHTHLPGVSLSACQKAVAQALGWKDPYALREALKAGQPPSLPDEAVGTSEALRRRTLQLNTLRDWCGPQDCEYLVEVLSLTRSPSTAARMMSDTGPWGGFDAVPKRLSKGLYEGTCEGARCYRLAAEAEDRMPPEYRLEESGWYGGAETWRVVLSFPELFESQALADAQALAEQSGAERFLLPSGLFAPDTETRLTAAIRQPSGLFALAAFPDWLCCGTEDIEVIKEREGGCECVVSAVKGADLLTLIENKVKSWNAKRAPRVFWFGMEMSAFNKAYHPLLPHIGTCISGLPGWEHPPIDVVPYKRELFGAMELDCTSFTGPMRAFAEFQRGTSVPIPG
jgi:hypothetical protein